MIHTNEWITTPLLMKFLENISKSYVNNMSIFGYNARELFSNVSLYIVPMVNPDGVDLVTGLFSENSWAYTNAKRISNNFSDIPFPNGWKANIEGIDFQKANPDFSSVILDIKELQDFYFIFSYLTLVSKLPTLTSAFLLFIKLYNFTS